MEIAAGEEVGGSPETSLPLPSAPERRRELIAEMRDRAGQGHHCGACNGVCCTFLANTMQITPLEAMDLKIWLEQEGRWNTELQNRLLDCVHKFRLDQDLGDGRRSLRRSHTCPFHSPGPLGCSIHPEHKPYGCLAFNPRQPGVTEGGPCASSQGLLEKQFTESVQQANQQIKSDYGLTYDKAPIPVALLTFFPAAG